MKRNTRLLALMGSSLLLLLVLQFFWVRSEYKSAEEAFRRETNLVFRNTVASLLDSLYMARIDLLPDDTVQFRPRQLKRHRLTDSVTFSAIGRALKMDMPKSTRIIVSRDSADAIPPEMADGSTPVKTFMIRINPDSLDEESLQTQYSENLKELNGNIVFRILKERGDSLQNANTAFTTDFIRIGPPDTRQYAASFEDVPLLLLREIYPQIAFSALLTMMIAIAFWVMYRSMITQQKLSQQKDEFINNVSHELKTPIATVNVALEAFKNFNVLDNPKVTHEYLDIVKTEMDRLSSMTEQILNVSVYEHAGIEVANEVINIKYTIIQLVKSINMTFQKSSAAAVETIFLGNDFTTKGSKMHLTNMIHNLIDNAIKHGRAATPVLVELTEEDQQLVLKVRDAGTGIPREYQEKIFEKFFRVPHGDVHNVKGYGLGLSYAMQVVKAHHGKMEVDSEEGKGSTFIVKLPRHG